jgi:hypothetical protein
MKSLGAMIKQLEPLVGTDDLNAWETRFVENLALRTVEGHDTGALTEKQIERLTELYAKHFGDA